jgi:hypothetical protein
VESEEAGYGAGSFVVLKAEIQATAGKDRY